MVKTDSEKIKNHEKRITKLENFIEKGGLSKNGRLLHCDGINKKTNKPCGNAWIYKGDKKIATCTSCGKKIKIE